MAPKSRLVIEYREVASLKPYENNPRLNEIAIPAVMNSIVEFGFRVPVIVDANGVLVAGHTRVLAVQRLLEERPDLADELSEVPVLVADDLTPEQINAFRLVDNKVGEIATWDFDRLADEVTALADAGIDLTGFGWTQEEIDCLHNVVSNDCLSGDQMPKDGVNAAMSPPRSLIFNADGTAVRIAWGTLAFMVQREDFDKWNDEIHKLHNYNAEAVIEDIAERMGLLEAKRRRDVLRGTLDQTGEEQQAENNQAA